MLQIIKAILKNSDDLTSVFLLFANRTEDDILCREELESIRDEYPHRVKLWFTLDSPPIGKDNFYIAHNFQHSKHTHYIKVGNSEEDLSQLICSKIIYSHLPMILSHLFVDPNL